MTRTIPLDPPDADAAEKAVRILRESMDGQADTMADELAAALAAGAVSEEVVARHSKWCHTGGSWAAGMEPARQAAEAMYGTVPERLLDSESRRSERYEAGLADLATSLSATWEQSDVPPSRKGRSTSPSPRRGATGEAVPHDVARAEWAVAAREVLERAATTYNATVTYPELADEVQARTDVVTQQLQHHWLGGVLGAVADRCVDEGQPIVTAVCVKKTGIVGDGYGAAVERATGSLPDDLEMHAAEERLRCYRHFGAEMPANGGRARLTEQEVARRDKARLVAAKNEKRAVCPTCFMALPSTGQCDECA